MLFINLHWFWPLVSFRFEPVSYYFTIIIVRKSSLLFFWGEVEGCLMGTELGLWCSQVLGLSVLLSQFETLKALLLSLVVLMFLIRARSIFTVYSSTKLLISPHLDLLVVLLILKAWLEVVCLTQTCVHSLLSHNNLLMDRIFCVHLIKFENQMNCMYFSNPTRSKTH